ncbi:undecaprenyldiphospho-muramoylpentapeptide beta-N-acetylglucosaminyltransferase [Prochlorococcus marinus]|uniref:UDP-N-acetylglucosamine--N-acetylmuramyl-(pentapeptide) pyrophosphoryl-undecaprenol N-acetylglucosamine transferase n=1 Tax=Prochlorococcus marinus (strain MIT 9211) TaxID=93059 RepID=MURG_PROM4|nr:undecaprenyldiphospho-muramoylpentapeptide beta-N-acetylglucosaminyltransferase [Prochlorococcus marinus]A9BDG0.1 RecName: Full=UDP-N-acetylglucosamine--N-acetylmuramyl-(pentapeptide) pyrophosphoryl-undecaprenol N-acetylglucosamine transferase; AltName: Full=Undecaprenyl-PP-MurNAc-pentapeptide-UDPGlcNAc GlcNAc transferase [Prochlorococcus marinus str. MIT 9211]ABX08146.1 Undecaprenyl-PP-MurNAc-pentapeptide-UDPGlcNAc GlcNAc transferase [Prochlorococcus marinus str. MIT 9211]
MSCLLIAASGTGGHLFPALAVAEALPESWKVSWLGVSDRLESSLIPKKYQLSTIGVEGVQSRGIKRIVQIFKLLAATGSVICLIRRNRIQIVLTTGGYIAVPAVLAAKLTGKKVILHESNAIPGKATRLLGRLCDKVALGWPPAKKKLPGCKVTVTGTPVRKSFLMKNKLPSWAPSGPGPLIVVIGGSQGAVGLNDMVRAVLPFLLDQGCRIVHITGKNAQSKIIHTNLVEQPFSDDIPGLLQNADLVISRSGAGALSEFAVCEVPAILVPYPYAADNHQECNAIYASQFGAALIVHQHEPEGKALRNALERLLKKNLSQADTVENLLNLMRKGMAKMAVRDAHIHLMSLLKEAS